MTDMATPYMKFASAALCSAAFGPFVLRAAALFCPALRSRIVRTVAGLPGASLHNPRAHLRSIGTCVTPSPFGVTLVKPSQPTQTHVSDGPGEPTIYSFFEKTTETWTYVCVDPSSSQAVVIDPVLDYDGASGCVSTTTADEILAFIEENSYNISRILETHAHADHITAAQYYKRRLGGNVPVCIGDRIKQVQRAFAQVYGINETAFEETFDHYFSDEEEFKLGTVSCRVIHLPGHTPDHLGYVFGKNVFTGDSIFQPDVGSARADFPGGNVTDLYRSMRCLLSLPSDYKLFVGHDYPPDRPAQDVVTVIEQREKNKHVKDGTDEATFTQFRQSRDAFLGSPRLLHPSLQVNIRAGRMPKPDEEGRVFLNVPIKTDVCLC